MKNEALKQFVVILLLLSFLIVLYGYRLNFPHGKYFDEVYHARRAVEFALEQRYGHRVSTHPPLWHFASAFFVSLFGNYSWAWRINSVLCGVLVVFGVYIVAKTIFKNFWISFLAAFLFTFDGMSFTQARIGMLNSMVLMFMLLSLFCFLQFFYDGTWSRRKAFFWAGLFLGLGLAAKMVASYLIFLYMVMMGIRLFQSGKDYGSNTRDVFLFLILMPLALCIAIQMSVAVFYYCSWADIWRHWRYAYDGLVLKKGHKYGSSWLSWPLMLRPIWYFYKQARDTRIVEGIVCMGNPAVFWMILPSVGYIAAHFFRKKTRVYGLISFLFFGFWLPWSWVGRVKFFHFFYIAMPFACMAIALVLSRLWQIGRVGKCAVIIYLILVVGMFIYWYPLLTGIPISQQYFKQHMWFKSWI